MGPDDDDESVDGGGSKLDQVLDLKDAKRTVERDSSTFYKQLFYNRHNQNFSLSPPSQPFHNNLIDFSLPKSYQNEVNSDERKKNDNYFKPLNQDQFYYHSEYMTFSRRRTQIYDAVNLNNTVKTSSSSHIDYFAEKKSCSSKCCSSHNFANSRSFKRAPKSKYDKFNMDIDQSLKTQNKSQTMFSPFNMPDIKCSPINSCSPSFAQISTPARLKRWLTHAIFQNRTKNAVKLGSRYFNPDRQTQIMVTSVEWVSVRQISRQLGANAAGGGDAIDVRSLGGLNGRAIVVLFNDNKIRVYSSNNEAFIPTLDAQLPIANNSVPTCMDYDPESMHGAIGSSTGDIILFKIEESLNSLEKLTSTDQNFSSSNVSVIKILPAQKLILALCGFHLYFYSLDSLLVQNQMPSPAPSPSNYTAIITTKDNSTIFLGTKSGTIEILDHSNGKCNLKNVLSGHTYPITALHYLSEKSMLFSGDSSGAIQMWFIQAGQQMINLYFHDTEIVDLTTYMLPNNKLYLASLCKSNHLVHWDLNRSRNAPAVFKNCSECQKCTQPFFWNLKRMYSLRSLSTNRRHHCRSCGASICTNCCKKVDRLPQFGLEIPSNCCFDCKNNFTEEDLRTSITELQHSSDGLKRSHFFKLKDEKSAKDQNALINLTSSFFQNIYAVTIEHNV